jgi:hypothetical protein
MPRLSRSHRLLLALVLLATPVLALGLIEAGFAVEVIDFDPGAAATSTPELALGAPVGGGLFAGSIDTCTLGVGGSLTLRLDPVARDDAGTDLIICENAFYVQDTQQAFVEALFVEVSSNGVDFARFATSYTGTTGPFPAFTGVPPTWYSGFAGVMPVLTEPGGADPLDVVAAGGDAFDLADLAEDPLVVAGLVDLGSIEYVRLVDVEGGQVQDSSGRTIWDAGLDGQSSADVDGVITLYPADNQIGGRPRVSVDLVNDVLRIAVEDDNGLWDVKLGLSASVNGLAVHFEWLLPYFLVAEVTPTRVVLHSLGPIPPGTVPAVLKVAARDLSGMVGGDALVLQ